MVKKLTAVLLTMCMAVSLLPMFAQAASKPDIKVGDYVKMGTYNNASILWRCVSIDDNGPLMLADRIVDTLAYDAKTNDNSNSKSHSRSYKRADYGSNYWRDSNCVPGSIQLRPQVRSIGFAVTRRRMVMSAEQGPIIIKRAF